MSKELVDVTLPGQLQELALRKADLEAKANKHKIEEAVIVSHSTTPPLCCHDCLAWQLHASFPCSRRTSRLTVAEHMSRPQSRRRLLPRCMLHRT